MLSGGYNDTPKDLVVWRAKLRKARGFIDLGVFLFRIVLWFLYDSVGSILLVKNLYNTIYTYALVERSKVVSNYGSDVEYSDYVSPKFVKYYVSKMTYLNL